MRARGLKQDAYNYSISREESRPMRARGLKPAVHAQQDGPLRVAPHAGAWIETFLSSF